MAATETNRLAAVVKWLTPVPLDGAAFLVNLFVATLGGMLLGSILMLVLLKPFEGKTNLVLDVIGLQIICVPAFVLGYLALWKFDQQSAMWTWAVGMAIWTCLVTIDLVNYHSSQYCSLNRWQHFWSEYIYVDSKISCSEGWGQFLVTCPMLCNVAYAVGAMVASRGDPARTSDS